MPRHRQTARGVPFHDAHRRPTSSGAALGAAGRFVRHEVRPADHAPTPAGPCGGNCRSWAAHNEVHECHPPRCHQARADAVVAVPGRGGLPALVGGADSCARRTPTVECRRVAAAEGSGGARASNACGAVHGGRGLGLGLRAWRRRRALRRRARSSTRHAATHACRKHGAAVWIWSCCSRPSKQDQCNGGRTRHKYAGSYAWGSGGNGRTKSVARSHEVDPRAGNTSNNSTAGCSRRDCAGASAALSGTTKIPANASRRGHADREAATGKVSSRS